MFSLLYNLLHPSIEFVGQPFFSLFPPVIVFFCTILALYARFFGARLVRVVGEIYILILSAFYFLPFVITLDQTHKFAVNLLYLPIISLGGTIFPFAVISLATILLCGMLIWPSTRVTFFRLNRSRFPSISFPSVGKKYLVYTYVLATSVILLIAIFGENIPRINLFLDVYRRAATFWAIYILLKLSVSPGKVKAIWIMFTFVAFAIWTKDQVVALNILLFATALAPHDKPKDFWEKLLQYLDLILKISMKKVAITTVCVVTLVVIGTYYQSLFSYFEGDEWVYFRNYRYAIVTPLWFIQGLFEIFRRGILPGEHLVPISNMIYVWQYKLFGLSFTPYIVQSLVTHAIVSLLYGKVIFELTHRRLYAFLAAVLFAGWAAHAQAVTWTLAAVLAENALLFTLISVIFLLKYLKLARHKYLWFSAISLLIGIFNKETVFTYALLLPVVLAASLFRQKRKLADIAKSLLPFFVVLTIAIALQFAYRTRTNVAQKDLSVSGFAYRYITLTSKMLAQSFVQPSTLINWSKSFTEAQFPYFNQEKEVQGTTYNLFTQTVGPEFFSHIVTLGLIIIGIILLNDRKNLWMKAMAVIVFLVGALPISLIPLNFPWWQYQGIVDSRHMYHTSPAIIILIILALEKFVTYIPDKAKHQKELVWIVLITTILFFQATAVRGVIVKQQEDTYLSSRREIIEQMGKQIKKPPKKMIIYTKSDTSFYGFAAYILPFQTAFSQVVPVIFDQVHHPNGHKYPESFYKYNFLASDGLASEGYAEDGEYAIGYFLDLNKVIKTMEKERLDLGSIFAFRYESGGQKLVNITDEIRNEIQVRMKARKIFTGWKRQGSMGDYMSFQTNPSWTVTHENQTYYVTNNSNQVMDIQIISPLKGQQFSDFISSYVIENEPIGNEFIMFAKNLDLDIPHNFVQPNQHSEVLFSVAGNSLMFYKINIYDSDLSELIIRTMEYKDSLNDPISL